VQILDREHRKATELAASQLKRFQRAGDTALDLLQDLDGQVPNAASPTPCELARQARDDRRDPVTNQHPVCRDTYKQHYLQVAMV
jgi:hypothetical protein